MPSKPVPRLTDDQRQLVTDYLQTWSLLSVARKSLGGMYRACGRLGIDDDEIESTCAYHILVAATKFDASLGKFESYVYWYIAQGLQSLLANRLAGKRFAATRNVTIEQARVMSQLERNTSWLNSDRFHDPRIDPLAVDPCEQAMANEFASQLPAALARLQDNERQSIQMRFGLDGEESTFQDIGDRLGVTREWARQLVNSGLGKLSRLMAGHREAA